MRAELGPSASPRTKRETTRTPKLAANTSGSIANAHTSARTTSRAVIDQALRRDSVPSCGGVERGEAAGLRQRVVPSPAVRVAWFWCDETRRRSCVEVCGARPSRRCSSHPIDRMFDRQRIRTLWDPIGVKAEFESTLRCWAVRRVCALWSVREARAAPMCRHGSDA